MCLKDINISGRMGGEEEPKVYVVYNVHIVQKVWGKNETSDML